MLNYPVHIEFELTNRCNLTCVMCPRRLMTRPVGDMDFEVFKKGIDESKGKTAFTYLHQIGEPLLYRKLIECINYASEANIYTSISTNCTLLNAEWTDKLLDSSLDEIYLCCDSLSTQKHCEIRNGSLDIQENIDSFIEKAIQKGNKIKIVVQMIKMNENKSEWESFKKKYGDMALVKDYSTFAGAVIKGESVPLLRYKCSKPKSHLTIQWNGDATVCCRDYDGGMVMGNIKDSLISDIWHSDKYNAWRADFVNSEFCRNC